MAHPVRDLERSAAFYRDLLGLRPQGGFTGHDGYDGRFFALPRSAELEVTTGPAGPERGTEEDLLVLYLPTLEEVHRTASELEAAGAIAVEAANPYWNRWGRTLLDPDGNRVVIAAPSPEPISAATVRVETYTGPRENLRGSFRLAEDSPDQLAAYLHAGLVLVAVSASQIVGHLQVIHRDDAGLSEIKNMAVQEDLQGRGIGARLVQAAVDVARRDSRTALVVATAAADVGNLRFYQRQGFRLSSVERDAFTTATGYPPGMRIDGIEVRDRVWLDRPLLQRMPPSPSRPQP
ncbi:GNAT family N-acetyltransferase [Geodermatophilus sp. SYSU D01062]